MSIYFVLFLFLFKSLESIKYEWLYKYIWIFVFLYVGCTFYSNYFKYIFPFIFIIPFLTIKRKQLEPTSPFIYLLALFLSINAALPITHHDYHGYYLQTIAWLREFGTVIGLGNLEARLGFNSFGLILASISALDLNVFGENINSILFPLNALFLLVFINRIISYLHEESELIFKYFFIILGLLSIVFYSKWIGTPSNDITAGLFISYIMLSFKKWLKLKDSNTELIIIIFTFLSIVIKLSSVLTILFLIPLFVLNNDKIKFVLKTSLIGFVILIPFLVKNILLTGYLIFPFPQLDLFHFDWKMPTAKVIEVKNGIFIWARIPGVELEYLISKGIKGWILDWLLRQDFLTKILLITNLIFSFVVLFSKYKRDIFISSITLIIAANLVFWFVQAPDPRFIFAFLFAGSSLFFSIILEKMSMVFKRHFLFLNPLYLFKIGFVVSIFSINIQN